MDGEIWPGNVREGERVKARIRPTACGRPPNPAAVAENAKAVGIIRRTNAECSCT